MARTWFLVVVLLTLSAVDFQVDARSFEIDVSVVTTEEDLAGLPGVVTLENAAGPKQKVCDICRQAAAELMVILSDPQTTEQAISIVEAAACANLPKDLFDKCAELVKEYVPQLVAALEEKVTPDAVCVETKICPAPGNMLSKMPPVAVKASPRCDICVQVASQILALLEDGKTQEQILAVLRKACERVKRPGLSSKCDALVELYFPQLIALVETVSPKEACQVAHYCAEGQLLSATARLMSEMMPLQMKAMAVLGGTPQECAACRFLVSQARKKLKDPDNQVKLVVFLTDACNRVADYADQCKEAVLEYLPVLFANVDTLVDPAKLCAKANLCPQKDSWMLTQVEYLTGVSSY